MPPPPARVLLPRDSKMPRVCAAQCPAPVRAATIAPGPPLTVRLRAMAHRPNDKSLDTAHTTASLLSLRGAKAVFCNRWAVSARAPVPAHPHAASRSSPDRSTTLRHSIPDLKDESRKPLSRRVALRRSPEKP